VDVYEEVFRDYDLLCGDDDEAVGDGMPHGDGSG
jgi:hypothetical protein